MPPVSKRTEDEEARRGQPSEGESSQANLPAAPVLADPAPEAPADAPDTIANAIAAVGHVPAGDDEKESVSRLIEEASDFFGHPTYVAAGAFSALAEAGVTELTRAQAVAVIEAWLSSATHQEARS